MKSPSSSLVDHSRRPRRQRAVVAIEASMAAVGRARGYELSRHEAYINLPINGIGVPDQFGRVTTAFDVKARLACNRHVPGINLQFHRSPGGSVRAEREISAAIQHHIDAYGPKHVTAYVRGICASAAVNILLLAKTRRAHPAARFLVHHSALSKKNDFRLTAEVLGRLSTVMRKEDERTLSWIAQRTGMSREDLDAILGVELSADRAKYLGLLTA